MSDSTPTQVNFLNPINFQFSLQRTPDTDYYVQAAVIPSIDLPGITFNTPVVAAPIPGDHLRFGSLTVSFKVDEEMSNYMEIYNWMVSVSQLAKENGSAWKNARDKVYSDGNLIILDSQNNPIISVNYTEMWPTSLSALTFDTRFPNINYLECNVTFAYQNFEITKV